MSTIAPPRTKSTASTRGDDGSRLTSPGWPRRAGGEMLPPGAGHAGWSMAREAEGAEGVVIGNDFPGSPIRSSAPAARYLHRVGEYFFLSLVLPDLRSARALLVNMPWDPR